ncbi:MAG: Ni/Fe hydrogenase subunit alpha [Candidatus Aenigmarchaeota archaeon]|nr:Ni/Fe hydrogenase subunit alpha [Candidatus Aenigmarchaeota archaeon]
MGKIIKIEHLTKIEGHASLTLRIEGKKVKRCELSSIEGSRYFEGMVKGRLFFEAPEMTSRICGICSCAHTLCSIFAMENALGIKPSTQTIQLRKLLNWGERIRSHATHLYFLSLPDFLGYDSALSMLPKHREKVETALSLMRLGNMIVRSIGGRDIHPVSAQIGGFLKLPSDDQLAALRSQLKSSLPSAKETARLFSKLRYPLFEKEIACFSVFNEKEYGMFQGIIRTPEKDYQKKNYRTYLREYHEKDTTANFVVKEGKSYRVGALARMNNSKSLLHSQAKPFAKVFPSHNPFLNNLAQAVELVHAIEECLHILEGIKLREEPMRKPSRVEGHGIAAIEVPRGTLWHEYNVKNNKISYCNIITPTTQNLRSMEEDIRAFLPQVLGRSKKTIVDEVEKLIRAYDPCFSCSSHFLDVKWL